MKTFIIAILSIVFASSMPLATLAQYGLEDTVNEVPAYKAQREGDNQYDSQFLAMKIGDIIAIVLSFVGVLFLVLIIFAGIKWMTAGGNDQAIEKAKSLIVNAVIGLLIVLFAYAITNFIGSQFLG